MHKKKIALNNRFSHIYVEKKILDNENTLEILSKFRDAKIIEIDDQGKIALDMRNIEE